MKEITREDWIKNPVPRMMWVWDDKEEDKKKRLVVHCFASKNARNSFVAENEDGIAVWYWKHCAEIGKPERMTNKGLSWWLHDHPEEHREWKNKYGCMVYNEFSYSIESENEPCHEDVVIRSNGGEWHEPLVEVEE